MNQIINYLNNLSLKECKKHLTHYFPDSFVTETVLQKFVRRLYHDALDFDNHIYMNPEEWLEKETEEFCTPDLQDGYRF